VPIELTQLLVVALIVPSLYLLSRTAAYGVLRMSVATAGVVLSGAWLLDRTGLVGGDPFASVTTALVAHPFAVAAVFALMAAVAYIRSPPSPAACSVRHDAWTLQRTEPR
jgi:hypothetical protein